MRTYQVVTILTDPAQYAAMADTFRAAGFGPDRARFTPLDNSAGNRFEPYAVLNDLAASADPEPVVILCHQDVRLDGDPIAVLDAVVDRVKAADPDWAVLGNAGVTYDRRGLSWLDDPLGRHRTAAEPAACLSLDENFLVLNRRRLPRMSPGLSGFHLYGTDVVLNAALAGRRSYVVPFLLTHLSAGNLTSPAFHAACRQFAAAWQRRVAVGIVNTTCANFVLARNPAVRWLLNRWRVRDALARRGVTFVPRWRDVLIRRRKTLPGKTLPGERVADQTQPPPPERVGDPRVL